MQEAAQPEVLKIILTSLGFMGGMGAFFGVALAYASKRYHVHEDPRATLVRDELPGANCGACGFAGCQAYAEAVVKDPNLPPGLCTPGKAEVAAMVAKITGKEVPEMIPMVATILCRGDDRRAARKFVYDGVKDCRAAVLVSGGDKSCKYGCLGYGTCEYACPFGAITMNEQRLPVVDREKCTACGVCVSACPKSIIGMTPTDKQVHVRCRSRDKGPVVKRVCEIGCTGCTLCSKNCPENAIHMENLLAVIDYTNCTNCETCVTICPQRTIEDNIDPSKESAPRVKPNKADKADKAAAPVEKPRKSTET
jgi:Na+-translocating ferredoxin:NAD+ oxidoreductase RNF subunit RnfB